MNDVSVIDKIMKLRELEKSDWLNELSILEKTAIDRGVKDAESGNLKPHSEAKKLYEKWL